MVKLSESISHAYEEREKAAENRVQELENLRKEVQEKVDSFKEQREKMSLGLQKDRKDLLGKLRETNKELRSSVKSLMDTFEVDRKKRSVEQAEMLQEFHDSLSGSVKKLLLAFNSERQDMKRAQDEDFASMMKSLENSVQDMAQEVQQLMKGLGQKREESSKKVKKQLDQLIDELRQGSESLKKVQKGKGGEVVPKTGEKTKKKKVESAQVPAVAEEGEVNISEDDSSTQKVTGEEPAAPLDLEGQVLEYIGNHPEGVRVGEMETPLGATRMRLGVIAKKLYESNRLRKEESLYFPL